MKKYKYNTINKKGEEEAWSGSFNTKEKADAWYERWKDFHNSRGHVLIPVEYEAKDEEIDTE